MEILSKLFGNEAKVKIMRLFLFNPKVPFGIAEIVQRAKVKEGEAKREISNLEKMNLIKRKVFVKEEVHHKKGEAIRKKVKVSGWVLRDSFPYLEALQNLLINVSIIGHDEVADRFKKIGRVKILIVAGVFIQDFDSRVDMLIVGDNIRKGQLDNVIKTLESELGRELRYSVFETSDFQYRLGIYDKLIRDILDFPHKKIIDKLGINY
jgi:hypothetical protein